MGVLEMAAGLGRDLISVLLPAACVVCGGALPVRRRRGSCCADCWLALPRIAPPRCERCSLPWSTTTNAATFTCIDCLSDPPPLDWIDAWGLYEKGLSELLQALKFRRHDFLARHLGELLTATYAARGDFDFDLIIPVPIHPSRRRERGFNQAGLLGEELARATGVPMDERVLRKRETRPPQSGLPKAARRANARGAYEASPLAAGKRILLVDDVATTGETLRACALELGRKKARGVAALVVARTP